MVVLFENPPLLVSGCHKNFFSSSLTLRQNKPVLGKYFKPSQSNICRVKTTILLLKWSTRNVFWSYPVHIGLCLKGLTQGQALTNSSRASVTNKKRVLKCCHLQELLLLLFRQSDLASFHSHMRSRMTLLKRKLKMGSSELPSLAVNFLLINFTT